MKLKSNLVRVCPVVVIVIGYGFSGSTLNVSFTKIPGAYQRHMFLLSSDHLENPTLTAHRTNVTVNQHTASCLGFERGTLLLTVNRSNKWYANIRIDPLGYRCDLIYLQCRGYETYDYGQYLYHK